MILSRIPTRARAARRALPSGLALLLAGCSVGPDYVEPKAAVPARYKEVKGWKPAAPSDAALRGPWWTVYRDPVLNDLEARVEVSNQTVRAAEANYRASVALIKEAQGGLFPVISASYSGTRSYEGPAVGSTRGTTLSTGSSTSTGGTGSGTGGTGTATGTGTAGTRGTGTTTGSGGTTGTGGGGTTTTTGGRSGTAINTFSAEANATFDLDVWGRIRRQIESDVAAAQVSDADLANAKLSAQAQLATAYFDLRTEDALHKLLADTVVAYGKTLEITQNQYAAGTAARSDVDNALAQLKTTQAQEISTGILRAQYEHAVAVLVGRVPAELDLRPRALDDRPVAVPPRLPSTLLERRPDVAAAERTMQQQSEQIGVQVAVLYPDFSLSGTIGGVGTSPLPVSVANEVWSLGGNATETLFDGGERLASVAAAVATYDADVATYRQAVLTAFQQVEDEVAALRILAQQASVQNEAVKAAGQAVDITLNEYRAGTVAFTSVVTAQATLLGDQEAALTIRQNRYLASVSLIQALGGGWTAASLPSSDALKAAPTPALSSPDLSPSTDVFTPKIRF